jgi:hypothetical protein
LGWQALYNFCVAKACRWWRPALFEQWPNWLARNRFLRRTAIKLWRMTLRVQRATPARAVVVLREGAGRILVTPSASGKLELPVIQLNAWTPITNQVQAWLEGLQYSALALLAVDGTPGEEGVTFVYVATLDAAAAATGEDLWLAPDEAAYLLADKDRQRLLLFFNSS